MEIKIIKVISYGELVKQRKKLLDLEIDYLLLSLQEAVKANDEEVKNHIKAELEAIVEELDILQA